MAELKAGQVRVFKLNTQSKVDYGEPDQELVESWVESYHEVGQYLINDIKFYTRPVNRAEYKYCQEYAQKKAGEFENLICTRSTLWPENFDFYAPGIIAGLPEKLCKNILDLSGFTVDSRYKILEYWRDKAYDQEERWDMLIEIAYPYMTTADLDNMPRSEYLHYLAKAEFRIRTQLLTSTNPEFNPDELIDLLLIPSDELHERLEKAASSIEKILAEQAQFEAAQNARGGRRR